MGTRVPVTTGCVLPMADEFRTMFLFGSEDVPERFGALRCVFCVKKNKAGKIGIQISA